MRRSKSAASVAFYPFVLCVLNVLSCGAPTPTTFHPIPHSQLSERPSPRFGPLEAPPYPFEARKAKIEGAVLLQVFIDHKGLVRKVRIIKNPGGGLGAGGRPARCARLCGTRPST